MTRHLKRVGGRISLESPAASPVIELVTGESVEAVGADQVGDVLTAGEEVFAYFGEDGALVGWLLTRHDIGVHLGEG